MSRPNLECQNPPSPDVDGHEARMALVSIRRLFHQQLSSRHILTKYGKTVYVGTFLFVAAFVFIIGAALRTGQPFFASNNRAQILSALATHAQLPQSLSQRKPNSMNIIFIVADDLGWNDIGYRNRDIRTPTLDNLARTGVVLNRSYVQSTCSPSRAALLTGFYPHRMGLQYRTITPDQAKFIPLNIPTLAEELKTRGYATHAVGKWHVGHCNWKYTPTKRGFDSHTGYFLASTDYYNHMDHDNIYDFWTNTTPNLTTGVYSTELFATAAANLIHNHANTRTEPLFLYLAFQAIHGPLNKPPKSYQLPHDNPKIKRVRYVVNDMVLALDVAVDRVVRALKQTGMMENTLLVFTTDNGGALDAWGDNSPLRGGKFSQWEGGTRAVTFINGPMIKSPGRIFDGLFHIVDWSPTILAAVDSQTGITIPSVGVKDGINQWHSLVENENGVTRQEMIYVLDEVDGTFVYRHGRYKLIVGSPVCDRYAKQMSASGGPDGNCWYDSFHKRKRKSYVCDYQLPDTMLFDLLADPSEKENIASQHPDIVDAFKRRLEKLKQDLVPNQSNEAVDISSHIKGNILYPGWC